jgi:hypothetical protein
VAELPIKIVENFIDIKETALARLDMKYLSVLQTIKSLETFFLFLFRFVQGR